MKRVNWARVWDRFDEWCLWMEFPMTNSLEYMKDKIQYLVNAELRGKKKGAKRK